MWIVTFFSLNLSSIVCKFRLWGVFCDDSGLEWCVNIFI